MEWNYGNYNIELNMCFLCYYDLRLVTFFPLFTYKSDYRWRDSNTYRKIKNVVQIYIYSNENVYYSLIVIELGNRYII